MLKMKPACERCHAALAPDGSAAICSYECTFCPSCTESLVGVCPNCDGELLVRPRRLRAPVPVAIDLIGRRVRGWLGRTPRA